jgi:hypothetical protein
MFLTRQTPELFILKLSWCEKFPSLLNSQRLKKIFSAAHLSRVLFLGNKLNE